MDSIKEFWRINPQIDLFDFTHTKSKKLMAQGNLRKGNIKRKRLEKDFKKKTKGIRARHFSCVMRAGDTTSEEN